MRQNRLSLIGSACFRARRVLTQYWRVDFVRNENTLWYQSRVEQPGLTLQFLDRFGAVWYVKLTNPGMDADPQRIDGSSRKLT